MTTVNVPIRNGINWAGDMLADAEARVPRELFWWRVISIRVMMKMNQRRLMAGRV